MISWFISNFSLSNSNNWRENIQCGNWKLLSNYGNLWMLWCVIPFLCFLYFIGRAANQAHENHLALEYLKQHHDTSSWRHVYGTAPTRHLHLVCLFNYLLLCFEFFLIVLRFWFIRLDINSGSDYSSIFICNHTSCSW